MRRLVLACVLLLLPRLAAAQTVTPLLAFTTTDALAKVTTYTATLQIGAAAVTTATLTCQATATGSSCTLPLTGFDATKATTLTVTLIDPSSGRTANGTLNYVPGTAPASFTLTLGWKVTVP